MSIVSGVGATSGINYDQLIAGLLEIERQPLYNLQNKKSTYNSKISVYSELSNRLSSLKTAVDALRTSTNFYAKKISSSDATSVGATVTNSATAGTYKITEATQLAQAHQITHTTGLADDDTTTVLATGNTFRFTINGETQTVTAASDLTLEELAGEINSLTYIGEVKVTASVVNTGTTSSPSYKLILSSNTTGSANEITIAAGDDQSILDLDESPDGDADGQYRTEILAAQDATFKVNGLSITRSSNTISDVITGVTFTLNEEITGTSSTTLTVTNDTDAIKDKVNAFVTAYNNVATYVASQSTYNTDTKVGGPFLGESTPKTILNKLRSIISTRVDGLADDMRALSQLGITTNSKEGTLSVNATTLGDKLSTDLDDVARLFTTETTGIADQIYDYVDQATDSVDGAVAVRIKGLTDRVSDFTNDITELEAKLAITQRNLTNRFAGLESLITGLTSQSSYLSSLFTRV